MNALSFLSPVLLYGMFAAAIPIIIHLLFRRRFLRVDWAPMRYLKLSIRKNRRRIRLEQLLLLLLRTFLIVLLFLFVARPVMLPQGLGAWLGGRSRTSQILILDDSLSMGFVNQGESAFQRAKELAVEILKTVGPKDRFTLVAASKPQSPVLREVEVTDRAETTRVIDALAVSETYAQWDAVLGSVDELVNSGTYPIREVVLMTDLRRAGWDQTVVEISNRWLSSRVHVRIFDVGSDQTGNLAIEEFRQTDRVALVGTPTQFEAAVHNATTDDQEGLEATFTIDGKPGLVRLPPIAAGTTVRIPLTATFQEAGTHHVLFSLPGDDLPGDDRRWAVTQVVERLRLLLIDGEPSSDPLAGEVDFLALALSLGIGEADAWQVEVTTDAEWAGASLGVPDLLVLANVAALTEQQARELTDLVEAGTGLMIFVGDQLDPDNYNQLLYKSGNGLLPAALESISDDEINGLILEDATPSALDALRQLNPAVLERIRIGKSMRIVQPDNLAPSVRVLARWNNAAASPAVLDKAVGKGRVLLWTITADRSWSDWPTKPSYVLAVREAAKSIARSTADTRSLTAGTTIEHQLTPGEEVSSAVVEVPDGKEPIAVVIESRESRVESQEPEEFSAILSGSGHSTLDTRLESKTLTFADTRRAGIYRMSWRDSKEREQRDVFAVNPDSRESELARIPAEELRNLFGNLEAEVVSAGVDLDSAIAVRGKEVWRTLAAGLLGLLVFEAGLATWAGRQR